MGLLLIFAATLIFLMVSAEDDGKDYRELLETDDIVILVIIMSRYLVQVARLFFVIKSAKANRHIHEEIKKIDLNEIDLNQTKNNSINFHDMNRIE